MRHHHRSSGLKQSNKGHKSNKSSKRSLNRAAGGKIQGRTGIKSKGFGNNALASKSKADRANMAKQRRMASKEQLLKQKRVQGRLNNPSEDSAVVPRVVGIISLSESDHQLEDTVRTFLVDGASESVGKCDKSSSLTAMYAKYKKEGHITFLTNSTAFSSFYSSLDEEDGAVQSALDLCRVCDTIMLLFDGRDADKGDQSSFAGMEIGGNASVTTAATNGQDYDHLVSARGERVLSAIKAQGLPTPMTILVNFEGETDEDAMSMASSQSMKSIRRSAIKKKLGLKRYLTRFAETEFGEGCEKVMELEIPDMDGNDQMNIDSSQILLAGKSKKILPDALLHKINDEFPSRAACVRALCTMSSCPPKWVAEMPRAYILSDNNGLNGGAYEYDTETKELKIKGYIRGQSPWNVNSLVHIPNVGTFGVSRIEKSEQSLSSLRRMKKSHVLNNETMNEVIASGEKSMRESLDMFASPDALDGEQNLIGFDDENADNYDEDESAEKGDSADFKKGVSRPAGWSDYQSAWLDAIQDENDENGSYNDPFDHGEMAFDLNKRKDDATAITAMDLDKEDANNISAHERKILLEQRKKDQEDETMFPDEVEVDEDENARDRYARYRSLKSFRKSYWDPKENLPDTYGTIYHFSSFKATQGDVMADMKDVIEASSKRFYEQKEMSERDEMMEQDKEEDDLLEGCVPAGTFVTIVIEDVSLSAWKRISTESLLTAVCLLPHENKISVLHMNLSQTTQCDDYGRTDVPVKSKDILVFRCGWRTWQARPVFSQNNLNCDKHKFERFMPTGGAFFSSAVFGPVTYTPCPVLVFRNQEQTKSRLVALGSIFNADADRIVVKRIILTGYPTRVHKRNATVKYMFYNPDDVKVSVIEGTLFFDFCFVLKRFCF